MKKCDIGFVTIIYAVCAVFLVMTFDLPADAQTYPLCLLGGLFTLNTLYIGRALFAYSRDRQMIDDFKEAFGDMQFKQFAVCVLLCAGYMVLLWLVGFYIASIVYLVVTMAFLRVPAVHIGLTTVVMMALIYGVFTLFLKVPLPVGELFK